MKTREVLGELLVYARIYDVDLPQQILYEIEEKQLHFDPEKFYKVEILFDTKVYELDEFYSFNITNPRPRPGRKERKGGKVVRHLV